MGCLIFPRIGESLGESLCPGELHQEKESLRPESSLHPSFGPFL